MLDPTPSIKLVMEREPNSISTPVAKEGVNRSPNWKITGQTSPSAAFTQNVEDSVENQQ
jgi:hypothetical protein